METIKIPTPPPSTSDELATKAAAWAWYQRGVGSEDISLEEIRTRRIHQVPRPSRFKFEAMRIIANTDQSLQKNSEKSSSVDSRILSSPTNHSDISLFDAYEIEMISKQFDSLIKHARDTYHHHQPYINHDHHQDPRNRKPVLQGNAISSSIKKNTKIWNGFWLGKPAARICGSSGDVVEPRRLAGNTDKGKIRQSAPRQSYSGERKSG